MILVVVNSVSVKVQTSAGFEAGQCQEPQVSVLCPASIEVGSLLRLFVSRWGRSQPLWWAQPPMPGTADLYWAPARPRVPTTANVCVRTQWIPQSVAVVVREGDLSMAWVRLRHDGCYLNAECVGPHDKLISDINCLQSEYNGNAACLVSAV